MARNTDHQEIMRIAAERMRLKKEKEERAPRTAETSSASLSRAR